MKTPEASDFMTKMVRINGYTVFLAVIVEEKTEKSRKQGILGGFVGIEWEEWGEFFYIKLLSLDFKMKKLA